ncbi:MAG: tetratricopeptide repeat protein [Candidatus Obscuribacterales bacterium]|nr:tetratricopeptide repeat protein [Candidatus Obscuribacterales bacterium]
MAFITNHLKLALTLSACLFSYAIPAFAEDVEWEKSNEQGVQALRDGRLDEAETILKETEEKLVEAGHQDKDLATVKGHMAEVYEKQGKHAEAEAYYKEAIGLRQDVVGDDLTTARSMVNLARMYESERKYDLAAEQYNKAGVIIDKEMGTGYTARHQSDIVNWLSNGAEKDEVVPKHVTNQAENIEKKLGADHPDSAEHLNKIGDFYREQGKYAQAEELYKQSADPLKEPKDAAAAERYTDLASLYQHKGNMEEAQKYFEKAEAILEQSEAGLDKRGSTFNKMAHFYEASGNNEKAEKYYKDALEAREQFSEEKSLFDNKPVEKPIAETLTDYAKFLHKVGKDDAADKLDSRAHDILDTLKTESGK